jgi:hypothetical protein
MVSERAGFGGAVVGLLIGMVVMILGVLQGGGNPTLAAGSALMMASVGWLALGLGLLESGGEPTH